MGILDNARKHFQSIRSIRGPILVPEWGEDGEPAKIYYRVLNETERMRIKESFSEHESSASILVLRALKEDGTPMFSPMERLILENEFDPVVVDRLVIEMATGSKSSAIDITADNVIRDETDDIGDDTLVN